MFESVYHHGQTNARMDAGSSHPIGSPFVVLAQIIKNRRISICRMRGESPNRGNACGRASYRETNVDTSHMQILNETSIC